MRIAYLRDRNLRRGRCCENARRDQYEEQAQALPSRGEPVRLHVISRGGKLCSGCLHTSTYALKSDTVGAENRRRAPRKKTSVLGWVLWSTLRRTRGRRVRTTSLLLLLPHSLLNSRQLLQLFRSEDCLDSRAAFLPDLHYLLLLLLKAHRIVVANRLDLLVLVIHNRRDFDLLV